MVVFASKNSPVISSLESFDPSGGNDGNNGAGETGLGTFGCFQNDCGNARNLIGTDSVAIQNI